MRISDWSSDVCSSDLGSEDDAHRARLWDGRDPGRRRAQQAGNDPDRGRGRRRAGLRPAVEPQHDVGIGQARNRHAVEPQRPTPRSEEHTSELQSLMRISYAVLCLKKNNTNATSETTQHTPDKNPRTSTTTIHQ